MVMLVPLLPLAAGALAAGYIFFPHFVGAHMAHFWQQSLLVLPGHDSLARAQEVPIWVSLAPLVVGLGGIGLAYAMYIAAPWLPALVVARVRPVYVFLLNKWYFDELYDFLFVRPAKWIGYGLWKGGDGAVIDGFGPDGISARVLDVTRGAVRLQSGYIYQYAFAMLLGVAAFATWYLFEGNR